jgi:hypothetical protein
LNLQQRAHVAIDFRVGRAQEFRHVLMLEIDAHVVWQIGVPSHDGNAPKAVRLACDKLDALARISMRAPRAELCIQVRLQLVCVFRLMPATDSGACRASVPVDAGPRFRSMPV